jgi:hypothetical protein
LFKRFLPARQTVEVRVMMDLDRLISEPVGFMLHGKIRCVKPLTQKNFMYMTNELAALDTIRLSGERDPAKIRKAYLELFRKACEPITEDDLTKMTDAQIGALVQQIIECVTGRAQASGEKKTLQIRSA